MIRTLLLVLLLAVRPPERLHATGMASGNESHSLQHPESAAARPSLRGLELVATVSKATIPRCGVLEYSVKLTNRRSEAIKLSDLSLQTVDPSGTCLLQVLDPTGRRSKFSLTPGVSQRAVVIDRSPRPVDGQLSRDESITCGGRLAIRFDEKAKDDPTRTIRAPLFDSVGRYSFVVEIKDRDGSVLGRSELGVDVVPCDDRIVEQLRNEYALESLLTGLAVRYYTPDDYVALQQIARLGAGTAHEDYAKLSLLHFLLVRGDPRAPKASFAEPGLPVGMENWNLALQLQGELRADFALPQYRKEVEAHFRQVERVVAMARQEEVLRQR